MKKHRFSDIINTYFISAWQNMKITKEIEERQRLDEIRFSKAGKGPLVKTYKYDPTKRPLQASPPSSAKK